MGRESALLLCEVLLRSRVSVRRGYLHDADRDDHHPSRYEYNESITCEYVSTTGAPIYLRFDSFATEAIYDKVEVYNGTAANGTLKGRFSGATVPASQVATSGSMYVRFTSNSGTAATSDIPAGVSMT